MRKLKDGDEIKNVIEPVGIGEIMASVGTLMPVMREILSDVRRLTSGPISDIAKNVNELIETQLGGAGAAAQPRRSHRRATSTA